MSAPRSMTTTSTGHGPLPGAHQVDSAETLVAVLVPGMIGTQTLLDSATQAGIELPEDAVIEPPTWHGLPSTASKPGSARLWIG
ncbi:hypothetical protein [Nocardia callitridis]|uniref:hypothetical protein n=1 Tax=Nocardia callitridis TaxID=648753 RepID=UPI0031E667B7